MLYIIFDIDSVSLNNSIVIRRLHHEKQKEKQRFVHLITEINQQPHILWVSKLGLCTNMKWKRSTSSILKAWSVCKEVCK